MLNWLRRKQKKPESKSLESPSARGSGGWFSIVKEAFPGAWQRNIEIKRETALAYHAVFACVTLITGDIGKMALQLKGRSSSGVWSVLSNDPISPLLAKPNGIQTRIQFVENWITSKLTHGNAYVLKIRDSKGAVRELRVLDPDRVMPLVSDDGAVFYQLMADNVTGILDSVTVPAREIIHDRFNCFYHPLVGLSPVFACGIAAMQGHHILTSNANFFRNGGKPAGIITVPGSISREKAQELKNAWDSGYSGENAGRTGVLADGMVYTPLTMTASDAQVVEQLKMSSEIVCSAFHVPLYKVGFGTMPTYNNVEALDQQYYSQCLQVLIESVELLLEEGLNLPDGQRIEFDLNTLLRMDSSARYKAHSDAINGGWLSPNEARQKENLPPVAGGDSPYLQQQNFSLEALAKRDSQEDPFGSASPEAPAAPEQEPEAPDDEPARMSEAEKHALRAMIKGFM